LHHERNQLHRVEVVHRQRPLPARRGPLRHDGGDLLSLRRRHLFAKVVEHEREHLHEPQRALAVRTRRVAERAGRLQADHCAALRALARHAFQRPRLARQEATKEALHNSTPRLAKSYGVARCTCWLHRYASCAPSLRWRKSRPPSDISRAYACSSWRSSSITSTTVPAKPRRRRSPSATAASNVASGSTASTVASRGSRGAVSATRSANVRPSVSSTRA